MRTSSWPWALVILLLGNSVAQAQFGPQKPAAGIRLDQQRSQRWQVGVKITAVGGPCAGLRGSIPIPAEWPEQQVQVAKEEISPLVPRVTYRDLGGVRQMLFSIPQLPAGQTASALVTLEITRHAILPPENTAQYTIPKNAPVAIRYDLGASPSIECRNPAIRAKAKELVAGNERAWDQVQAIYDWVRENIKQQDGQLKGAAAALKDGTGNRDDLTCLFIALCRASDVPARTVFVADNCYAEFYLEDEAGKGSWFPCQVAGTREFGGMSDYRPILQKGDHIRVPDEHKDPQRFVAEYLTGKGGRGGRPQVEFVRKLLPAN